jgi:putative aldouronate transport system substrate-binding protein
MKKIILMLLAVILVLSACSSTKKDETANPTATNGNTGESQGAVTDKKVTLTAFSRQSPYFQDYVNNDFTKLIEDKFNVKMEWTLGPPTDESLEKQNVLLASGNYPAVFIAGQFNQFDQVKYGKSGIIVPLNDLIDKYGPNIKAAFKQSPYILKAVTAPDGNIYSLPGVSECGHCYYAQKYWINKDWLKTLNLQMPTTTDELYQVLKAFKEKDPNGNGKPDEIGITGSPENWHGNIMYFIMNAFIYAADNNILTLTDGKVDISANKPEWKDGLAFLNKLYSEGLIDKQAFTQKLDGFQSLVENPDTAIVGAFASGCCYPTVVDNGRHTQYQTIPPLKGPKGVQLSGYFGEEVNPGLFAITNKATEEQKIKAIQIVDYVYSEEGSLNEMYGPKGVGWRVANPGEKDLNGQPAKYFGFEFTRSGNRQLTWDNELKYTPKNVFDAMVTGDDPNKADGYGKYLNINTDPYVPFKPKETFPTSLWLNPDDAVQLAQIKTDITNYISTNAAQFITGQKDLNKDWDAYVKGFAGLGLDQLIKANQVAYDAQYK